MKYNDVATFDRLELVHELIDEDPLLILQTWKHARALYADWLVQKNDE